MTLLDTLHITYDVVTPEHVEMSMPISEEIYQPHGFLHGGATLALLESCASRGAEARTDFDKELPLSLIHICKGKNSTVHDLVLARGASEADWERIKRPIGLKFGAKTPAELAISIVAELVDVRSVSYTHLHLQVSRLCVRIERYGCLSTFTRSSMRTASKRSWTW